MPRPKFVDVRRDLMANRPHSLFTPNTLGLAKDVEPLIKVGTFDAAHRGSYHLKLRLVKSHQQISEGLVRASARPWLVRRAGERLFTPFFIAYSPRLSSSVAKGLLPRVARTTCLSPR